MSLKDNHFFKSPYAKLDYTVNLVDWLADGETISSVSYTVQDGLTEDTDLRSNTTTSATTWVSGGTLGTKYSILYVITTSAWRTVARTIYVTIAVR